MKGDSARVLVISHNVFGSTSNMGRTLANFFEGYPAECLAQLYFHSQHPTLNICDRYYRVTDFDVLKKKKKETGMVFESEDIKKDLTNDRIDSGRQAEIYQLGRKRKPYMYIARNLLWGTKKWKNQKLLNWIDSFDPQVIFFASGDYAFAYRIAMEIAEYKKIPIITYVCDDYYFLKQRSISPLYWFSCVQRHKAMKKLFARHRSLVAICDKISEDYGKEFGVNGFTVMTGSALVGECGIAHEKQDVPRISYIGNLGLNRHEMLTQIGKTLLKLYNGEILIDVYSEEKNEQILKEMTEENGIRFQGRVSYDEVLRVMKKSDILLHVESMDKKSRERVKYSVSTKVADSLASGVCLFAYGPEEVASMQYLLKNNCAAVVTNYNELETRLKEVVENCEIRNQYAKCGIEVAEKNHSLEKNSSKISEIIKVTLDR